MSKDSVSLYWFRNDLRKSDNPGLVAASKRGKLLPVYIYDDKNCKSRDMGSVSKSWLYYSLQSLNDSLGVNIFFAKGDPLTILKKIFKDHDVKYIFWGRCYSSWEIKRDIKIKKYFKDLGVEVKTFNNSLIWEPWEVSKSSGGNYRVFTPFFRKGCLKSPKEISAVAAPAIKDFYSSSGLKSSVDDLKLFDKGGACVVSNNWDVGEKAALKKFKLFAKKRVFEYATSRDFPGERGTSMLSPHIHFGEISPRYIWCHLERVNKNKSVDVFLSEIAWREFSYSLLYYYPDIITKNLQKKFDRFPWVENKKYFNLWSKGMTGYPIVDAGMRQLLETGYIHNRVRMVVASFLVKNLLIDWRAGEKFFWNHLVDADAASNSAGWQWVAGSGADAAPFFRVFNPVLQGKKFDPSGKYVRKYIPELSSVPDKFIHCPWDCPVDVLQDANIKYGKDYPLRVVDIFETRDKALSAYNSIK